ncbi:hypothetical protein [Actinocorallia longicatena]|uniref:HEAT repeat protein n=1 Tax=Actinocorallia longicatena TaxID=111803 RepID=A0ABP6QGE3_9ACTN
MAWQFHYTSARSATRSGFQFTAVSPDPPPGAEADISPYLGYRPPPDAPPSPSDAELADLPVALGYDVVNGRALLVRSRYLGKDYSGRFGNFLAHAVLADPAELEGYRPIEFWQAPFWHEAPAASLPALHDPLPGDAFDPDSLGHWLAALPDPYPLLTTLLDALTTGQERIILVSPDAGEIARWIAVLSYSLPVTAAAALSFTTYSADPVASPHRLVGTTPDTWASLRTDHPRHVLPPGRSGETRPGTGEGGPFARAVAACWRERDLEGLDALAELAELNAGGYEAAAVLLAICRGGEVPPARRAAAVRLLGEPHVPGWVWSRLDPRDLDFDVAAAVHRHSPVKDQVALAAYHCARLAINIPDLRPRLGEITVSAPDDLAPALERKLASAETLGALAGLTSVARELGVQVLGPQAQRTAFYLVNPRPGEERDPLEPGDLVEAVRGVADGWRPPLLAGICDGLERGGAALRRDLLDSATCDVLADVVEDAPMDRCPEVALHLLRSLTDRHGVHGEPTVALARRLPGNTAAAGLLAAEGVPDERDPKEAARALGQVSGALATHTVRSVADRLKRRSPVFRASLLKLLDRGLRDRLIHRWIETADSRGDRFELVGVALRAPGTPLDAWVRTQTAKKLTLLQLEAYFRDDQSLRAALRELRG